MGERVHTVRGRETHADVANRRARIAIVVVLITTGLVAAVAPSTGQDGDAVVGPASTVAGSDFVAMSVDLASLSVTAKEPSLSATPPLDLSAALQAAPTGSIVMSVGTAPAGPQVGGTATPSAPPTTEPPTTTTTEPPPTTTTTEPPPPTTTTVPPTTTTEPPPPTTTVPPPTTTEPPPATLPPEEPDWYAVVWADVACDDGEAEIEWSILNPKEDWSKGWTLIIDGDNRGVFSPGTSVKRGKTATESEQVESGTYTLSVSVHWSHGGEPDSGFGTYSATAVAECDGDDD